MSPIGFIWHSSMYPIQCDVGASQRKPKRPSEDGEGGEGESITGFQQNRQRY